MSEVKRRVWAVVPIDIIAKTDETVADVIRKIAEDPPSICTGGAGPYGWYNFGSANDETKVLNEDPYSLRSENARLRKALESIAEPVSCGCVPCTGQCRSEPAKAAMYDELVDLARQAVAGGGEKETNDA